MLSALDLMNTSAKWKIGRVEQGQPLLEVVTHHLGMSKKQAKRLLDARSVFVNHRRVWMARHPLQVGDEVEVVGFRPPSAPARPAAPPRLRILRETAAWLAVDKPAGLLTNGPDSLESLLRAQRQEPALEAVHRLDRDTTGCILFARHAQSRATLLALFEGHAVRKTYVAIVQGAFPSHLLRVDKRLDGLEAVTDFRVRDANARASLVEARPQTGRTHQLRLHVRAVGHPLAGDRTYATGELGNEALRRLPRQMLHAWRLAWTDAAGEEIKIEAPWPADFQQALRSLGLRASAAPVRPCDGT
jgi:23S rRNA pseudouridine1911/1915/1917 synthase